MSDKKLYKIIKKEELPNNELEIEVEVPYSVLEQYRESAVKDLSETLNIDGFRKGTAPEKMVVDKVGELAVVEKSAYRALNSIYPLIAEEENIESLTQPSISITKIAPNTPLVFKAKMTLMPKVKLADYKKIAKEIKATEKVDVTDKEIDDYIDYIRKNRAQAMAMNNKEDNKDSKTKNELPPFDDNFVKTLGDFKDVNDFKNKLKENMLKDKEIKENQKRRLEIIEKIINESEIDTPDILIDEELNRMMGQFNQDIERMQMKPEEYLKEIKKTEDDLKKEWRPDAIKRTKMNIILPKIADAENIKADSKEVEKEVKHLKNHHKDLNEQHAALYVTNVLTNEEVFKFLESIK